jgi:type I restriction enzyme S subunit
MAAVEQARAATRAQLAAAKALPAAYLRQVFDSPAAQKWERKRLGEVLLDIEAGKCVKCDGRSANFDEWGVLKVSAVSWGRFKPEQNKVLPEDFVPSPSHEVQSGDLIISRANTTELVGAVVLVDQTRPRLMLSDKTLRLVPSNRADKAYLELALRECTARNYIEEHGTGTSDSMKNITQETIRNIPILIPSIDKQIKISEAHRKRQPEIEKILSILQEQLDAISQLPAALLRQAFNGEL